MLSWKKNRYFLIGLTAFLTFACCVVFLKLFISFDPIGVITGFFGLLTPFFIGFAIAYLVNPVMKLFEKKVFIPLISKTKLKKTKGIIRLLSVFVSMIIAVSVIIFLLTLLIPQVINSVIGVSQKIPEYINKTIDFFDAFFKNNPQVLAVINQALYKVSENLQHWLTSIASQIPIVIDAVASGVLGVVDFVKDLVLGIIISFYALYNKERFISQSKKLLFALFSQKNAFGAISLIGDSNSVFSGFITGVLIDSTLVGIICFIGVSLMGMPYPILIACLVGVFNVIPFLGPFLGGIPSAILILLETPEKTIWFIIFMVVLQQFDGNIMSPRILGNATGLPTFWTLFAIIVGGGLFGFLGMFLGVPVFSIIYTIISQLLKRRLKRKNLPQETEEYYDFSVTSSKVLDGSEENKLI